MVQSRANSSRYPYRYFDCAFENLLWRIVHDKRVKGYTRHASTIHDGLIGAIKFYSNLCDWTVIRRLCVHAVYTSHNYVSLFRWITHRFRRRYVAVIVACCIRSFGINALWKGRSRLSRWYASSQDCERKS